MKPAKVVCLTLFLALMYRYTFLADPSASNWSSSTRNAINSFSLVDVNLIYVLSITQSKDALKNIVRAF